MLPPRACWIFHVPRGPTPILRRILCPPTGLCRALLHVCHGEGGWRGCEHVPSLAPGRAFQGRRWFVCSMEVRGRCPVFDNLAPLGGVGGPTSLPSPPGPPPKDWTQFSSRPSANQLYSVAPSVPISLVQKFSLAPLAPLSNTWEGAGGRTPPPPSPNAPSKGALPAPAVKRQRLVCNCQ